MAIKIKDSGTFKDVDEVHIKDSGTWKRAKRVLVKDSGTWEESHRSTYYHTISSNTNKVDLDLLSLDRFYDVVVTINSGVYVYSDDTSTPALKTGTGYGGTLTIINNGYIYGAGGTGGLGGGSNRNGYAGTDGGTALSLEGNITLTNNGSILGGGGGGGGGGAALDEDFWSSDEYASGGGGGGGQTFGSGGNGNTWGGGSAAQDGTDGTLTAAGLGKPGGSDKGDAIGGTGGNGGAVGQSGSNGNNGSTHDGSDAWSGTGGSAGAAGTAIDYNGFTA